MDNGDKGGIRMRDQRPGMFVPALIGGAAAGVLSGIPLVNCLCCLWIIGGGMLAAYFFSRDSVVMTTAGDGAIVGIFSGIIAAIVGFIISLPFSAISEKIVQGMMNRFSEYYQDMPSEFERFFSKGTFETSLAWTLLGLVFSAVAYSALGALGGIIGISLFGKKKGQNETGVVDVSKNTGDRQS